MTLKQSLTIRKEECRFLPDLPFSHSYQGSALSSDAMNIGEHAQNEPASCKTESLVSAKKNPDALAGAVEANLDVKAHSFRGKATAKPSTNAMMKFAKPEHKRMSRTLGYALTLGTFDGWLGFTTVASVRMSDTERASLAFAALNSLDLDQAEMVATAVIRPIGTPMPPFLGGMDDARWWADRASRSELKAYALAAHDAMNAQDQAAFFQHIREVEIAA